PTVPNDAEGDPIDSTQPQSVPLSVPWSNSPSGPRATSWISPGPVAQAPIGQSTGTVVLPSRASGTPRELGGWNSPRSPRMTSSSAAGPRQKTVTPRSPLAMATGEETFSAIADQRRGFAIAAIIRHLEAKRSRFRESMLPGEADHRPQRNAAVCTGGAAPGAAS